MESNAYEVLGLKPGVSREALKRRYRDRLREVHPDLNPQDPDSGKKTQQIVEAYKFLADPNKRAALDQHLREAASPPPRTAQPKRPKEPPRTARTKPAPRRPDVNRATTRSHSRSTITINGQRIDVGGNGSVNVVINNSGVHVQSGTQNVSNVDVGDATMGGGSMSGQVMGDLHIRSGSTAHISGQVMGDVFVGPSSQVTISGQVMGDVHAKGSSLRLVGTLMGDLFVDPGSAVILGTHMGETIG